MTKEEALTLLRSDVARFNSLRGEGAERLDMKGVDLSHANLQGADLRRIDFSAANFQGANLKDAQLNGNMLQGADFQGADLTGANFHHARVQKADMRGAKFTANTPMGRLCVSLASFEGVRWDKAHLEEVLTILNQNRDWLIKYEIAPKAIS